ncbi:MAG TPA: hypothetical protein VHM30_11065 [Gemmatimonadaceae bacterium]|nr:hypothetical protein [Gemmatimonadaceae bacterium]
MRTVTLVAASAVIAATGCHQQLQVVSPSLAPQPTRIAMPADTAFVRRICFAPDSVLAGTRPCYERTQQSHLRIF